MSVLAAVPWTYWMALPILVLAVCAVLGFFGIYLKRVVEPRLLREDQLRALELTRSLGLPTGAPEREARSLRPTAALSDGRHA